MKKSTIVLTAAALAASLLGQDKLAQAQSGSTAQSLASLTAKGYDPTTASSALAANSDAAALLSGINAVRQSNGLAPLTLDASLGAATNYQEGSQLKYHYVGNFAMINGGTGRVRPAQMAADYGSPATAVQEFSFGNAFFPADTDNWPALLSDWQQSDVNFAAMLNSPAVNVAGINLIDTGSVINGQHIYKWALMVGYNPNAVTANAALKPRAISTAQSLASLTAKGYDATLAANALAATTDSAALLSGINAVRQSNGLAPLTLDASLGAATNYQEGSQLKYHYVGNFAMINGGTGRVRPAQMAADYGSPATAVQEFSFGNAFFPADTDNWPALLSDWQQSDVNFAAMLNSPAVNVAGINLIDTGSVINGQHIYKWALMVGYNPNAVTTTGPAGPTLNLAGLDPALAQQALAATPTADEAAFLAAINAYRGQLGHQPMALERSLCAAAFYDARAAAPVAAATLAPDFGSLHTTYAASANSTGGMNGYVLPDYGNWALLVRYYAPMDRTSRPIFSDGAYSHCGLSLVDTGTTAVSAADGKAYEVFNWAIVVGK